MRTLLALVLTLGVGVGVGVGTGVAGGEPPYEYSWDFGDGGSSDQQSPCHTYQDLGMYTAAFTVTDADDEVCQVMNLPVEAGDLRCSLEADPMSGPVPLPVIWTATASQGTPSYTMTLNGTFTTIGDTVMQATIYNNPGEYTKTFTVQDSSGDSCEETVTITAQ